MYCGIDGDYDMNIKLLLLSFPERMSERPCVYSFASNEVDALRLNMRLLNQVDQQQTQQRQRN